MSTRTRQVPGTGLSVTSFALITALSVAVFIVWGGLLWRAPREASHVMRFAVSYLIVIPVAALALWAARRWSWGHLLAATGLVWCAKLLLTAGVFLVVARGTAVEYHPAEATAPSPRTASAPAAGYAPAAGSFARGDVAGRVTALGQPLAGAVVWIEKPAPGAPAPAPASVELVIEGGRHRAPLSLVRAGDAVRVKSRDAGLHTAHLLRDGRAVTNQSMPPGGTVTLPLRGPGVYQIRCDNHARETAWLVVVDHPYAARTGEDGRFLLADVPAGAATLAEASIQGGGIARTSRPITVAAGAPATIEIEAAPAHATAAETHPPAGAAL